MTPRILVQAEDFDPGAVIEELTREAGGAGAVVAFVGLCRDEDGRLAALELEHYPGMAEEEMRRVVDEAAGRWPLLGATAIHRHGVIRPGERIVMVAAASRHRDPAFSAASFLMDFLKTRAPFWKREHLRDGSRGGWVEARERDEEAAAAWQGP